MRLLKVEVGDVYGHYSVPAHVSSDTSCVKVNRFASISDVLYPCFAAEKYFSLTPFCSLVHEYYYTYLELIFGERLMLAT